MEEEKRLKAEAKKKAEARKKAAEKKKEERQKAEDKRNKQLEGPQTPKAKNTEGQQKKKHPPTKRTLQQHTKKKNNKEPRKARTQVVEIPDEDEIVLEGVREIEMASRYPMLAHDDWAQQFTKYLPDKLEIRKDAWPEALLESEDEDIDHFARERQVGCFECLPVT